MKVKRTWSVTISFNPHDIWVGVYWTRKFYLWSRYTQVYVCVLPMLPILIQVEDVDEPTPYNAEKKDERTIVT